jgi:CBS domain-containing protein
MMKQSVHLEPFAALGPETSIIEAIDRMEEMKVSDFPVVNSEGIYLGLVSEDALLEYGDDNASVTNVINPANAHFVLPEAHYFDVLAMVVQYRLTSLPIVAEDGTYQSAYLLSDVVEFFRETPTLMQPGAIVTMSVEQSQYSLITIANAVEQNDAKLLGLWLVAPDSPTEVKMVLKLNVEHSTPIVQSLERYDYRLEGISGDANFELDYKERFNHLMNYLKY